jgi:hypothetical protein
VIRHSCGPRFVGIVAVVTPHDTQSRDRVVSHGLCSVKGWVCIAAAVKQEQVSGDHGVPVGGGESDCNVVIDPVYNFSCAVERVVRRSCCEERRRDDT